MSTNSGDLPARLTVFLSGTYDDLEEYRLAVRDALSRGHFPLDSHQRAGNLSGLLTRIREQILRESHAYVGIFSDRYGSLVPGLEEAISYSEYEFDLAVSKWGTWPSPPLFVYRPKKRRGCDYEAIRRLSDEVDDDNGVDAEAIRQDRERQQRFLAKVSRADEPQLNPQFCSREELITYVLADLGAWQAEFLHAGVTRFQEQSASYRRQLQRHADAHHTIGLIGRDKHLSRAEAAHETLVAGSGGSKKAPGMCLLIYGRERHGQASFARLLASQPFWKLENETRYVLEKRLVSAETMIWWRLWEAVGQDPLGAPDDTDALADRAAETCADRPVFLRIENVHHFDQGVKGFADRVWTPLYRSLHDVWAKRSPEHHVFVVLTCETGGGKPPKDTAWQGAIVGEEVDYGRVLPLPELGPLSEDQVEAWLRPRVPSRPERWSIVSRVLGDGSPEDVFERLMKHTVSMSPGSPA